MKFCSLDYYEQVRETANIDKEFLSRSRGFAATFRFEVTDRLDELPPVFMRFEGGEVTEARLLHPDEKTDFALEAPYEAWVKVGKGELDGATAIMIREIKFFGSMEQIMKHAKAFQRLLTLMMTVPVEY